LSIALIICGCTHSRNATVDSSTTPAEDVAATSITESSETQEEVSHLVAPAGFEAVDENAQSGVEVIPTVEQQSPSTPDLQESEVPEWWGVGNEAVLLEHVIASVYQSYPLLESALYSRTIAAGEQLAASGAFDLKLKAASENGPTGFYQTYRQSVGLVQPIYHGGEAFAGYRIGRGDFQPWYLERQTNGSGEFKAGLAVPLARNRDIDSRRADLWRSNYGRQLVEPDIQAQLIGFVQEASYIYWTWVAAGENVRIADRVLQLAEDRTERISRQVEEGLLDPPELTDNLRLVAERRGKLADAERKFQQTAIKLSLYYRDLNGEPLVPSPKSLPAFPDPLLTAPESLNSDIQIALEQRPEIYVLNMMRRQLDVDYAESQNDLRPNIDAVVAGSQDIGEPTSSKNDKGQFELDASIFVDVPLQRRKAQGKMQAIQAKIAQLSAKRKLTEDKIVTDVQSAYAGLVSAYEQVQQAQEAVEYAEDLARRERLNFEQGASDLLKVTLREQYAAEAAAKVVDARLLYFQTQADYRAALAQDRLP
ncbi:MAG: TolC family protein, partial [Planctomycetaceae bacterium]|nr:TolC family protein [Planctomycetaceae bacterium]